MAIKAAGKGGHLLSFFFRSLALLVFVAHVKFQYFHFFDLKNYEYSLCKYQINNCAIAKVVDSRDVEAHQRKVTVKFTTNYGKFVKRELDESSEFYILPNLGEEILLRYT